MPANGTLVEAEKTMGETQPGLAVDVPALLLGAGKASEQLW